MKANAMIGIILIIAETTPIIILSDTALLEFASPSISI